MDGNKLIFVAATSATYNIILQLSMRILTFILNAFILRYITKDVLGVINVRLLLLYTTLQFLNRESFRRACLSSKQATWSQVINMTWCIVPLSIFSGIIFRYIWLYWLLKPEHFVHEYDVSVNVIVISVIIEMLAEPIFITAQCHGFVRLRVVAEGLALVIRSIVMVTLVVLSPENGISAFSTGQFLASVVYTLFYYFYFYIRTLRMDKNDSFPFCSIRDFFPKFLEESFIDWNIFVLTWSFLKQTILKQLLTEGEKYVMSIFNILSFAEQGVYDVVNNLGSLAARFVFQPIEESGYLYFAQMLKRDESIKNQSNEIAICVTIFKYLLKLMIILGLIILTFGYSYAKLLLYFYGGSMLASGVGPTLLRWHCFYVLFLAVNGVTECFVFAAMNQNSIDKYNRKMLLLSCIFLMSSYFLTKLFGGTGFIMANCLNMTCRIAHSIYFIHNYFQGSTFQPLGINIKPSVLIAFIASFCVTCVSENYLCCSRTLNWILHIIIGGLCFLFVMFIITTKEKSLFLFLYKLWKKKNILEDMNNDSKKLE
ncbi:man(5)GlcNAc(2)-PP-dolichol translocation protein RFT1 [Centruroides vittatus]|uniref:man(5)GlcNAc(2)-PP-dolichol translocation protein RFT1 n=1 Tax=Centruroides vittatus TaxID=120091 RepID=UPI00350EEBF5